VASSQPHPPPRNIPVEVAYIYRGRKFFSKDINGIRLFYFEAVPREGDRVQLDGLEDAPADLRVKSVTFLGAPEPVGPRGYVGVRLVASDRG
jgi:hypothetical protein